ncbi:MAG: hypothetical protein LH645_01300 [Actinomycetia bacterium]|nr:hypothetical protein [Actinomycetes bacterium]
MTRGTKATLIAAGLTSVFLLVGSCGSSNDPAASTPTPNAPDSSPDHSNLCLPDGGSGTPPNSGPETDGYLDLSEKEAKQYAAENNQTIRIAGRDGECFPLTMDYRANRVNLYLQNAVVGIATIG